MMRCFAGLLVAAGAMVAASTAWGQIGLYGSPEVLRLPEVSQGWEQAPARTTGPLRSSVPAPRGNWGGRCYGSIVPVAGQQAHEEAVDSPTLRPAGIAAAEPTPAPDDESGAPSLDDVDLEPTPEPSTPALMDQMLGGTGAAAAPCSGSYYPDHGYEAPAQGVPRMYGPDCEPCGVGLDGDPCGSCRLRPWFVEGLGLVMGRDHPNAVVLTVDAADPTTSLLTTQDADLDFHGGAEIRFGRWFCDRKLGIEAAYWFLAPQTFTASQAGSGLVSTPLAANDIEFAGVSGAGLFNDAQQHRLWRRNEFHNVEINVLKRSLLCDECHPLDLEWFIGARYFRFDEELTFSSLADGGVWGENGGVDEAYLDHRIVNDLVGFQIGLDTGYRLTSCLRLSFAPKVGIYNNSIDYAFNAYRGDGAVASPTTASGFTGTLPVRAHRDSVSFLTELQLGLDWQINPCWSATAGYRIVAVTGMGLADEQIAPSLADTAEIAHIDRNGHLILHGAYVGLTYAF